MSSLDIFLLMAENSLAFKPLIYSICVTSVDICVTIEIPILGISYSFHTHLNGEEASEEEDTLFSMFLEAG